MSNFGHNEAAVRLAALAGDAQIALDKVAKGEADAIEGWLAYGAALNEGRALFPSDENFGKWVKGNLPDTEQKEREAAMWAAANRDQFEEARAAGNARTVRGIHAQWKKIEQEREKARQEAERTAEKGRKAEKARKDAEAAAKAEQEARAAVISAETEGERQEAEAIATKAAEAKVEAERVAEEAEAMIPPAAKAEPEEEPQVVELRSVFRSLTPDGQESDFIDLHMTVRDQTREIDELKAEIAKRDAWWTASDGGRNKNRSFALADTQIKTAEGRMAEYQAAAARLQRQVNAQESEIKKLRAEVQHLRENQVFQL